MLLVPWKRLVFGPPFLFQIGNDVQSRRGSRLVTPKFAHLLDAGKMMPQFAVAHPVGRLARKLIQPVMHLFKRMTQRHHRFRAMFCKRRHKLFRALSIPITRTIGFTGLVRACLCWGRTGVSRTDLKSATSGLNLMCHKTCIDILAFHSPRKERVFPCSARVDASCMNLPSGTKDSNSRSRNIYSSNSWFSFYWSAGQFAEERDDDALLRLAFRTGVSGIGFMRSMVVAVRAGIQSSFSDVAGSSPSSIPARRASGAV